MGLCFMRAYLQPEEIIAWKTKRPEIQYDPKITTGISLQMD